MAATWIIAGRILDGGTHEDYVELSRLHRLQNRFFDPRKH